MSRPDPAALRPDVREMRLAGVISEREVIAGLGGRAAIALGIIVLALVIVPAGHQEAPWLFVAAGAFAMLVGILVIREWARVPVLLLDVLLVGADGLLVLLGRYHGPMEHVFPGVYLVIGTIVSAARTWPVVSGHLALLGASYAGVLVVGPHHPDPLARWFIVLVVVLTVGVFLRWLVSTVTGLAMAEHGARDVAEQATRELERENEARSHFLARMSHELRTPLNVVLGFADLLGEQYAGSLNDKQREYVKDVSDSARHLVALVDDVLDLDHVSSGDVRMTIADVDVTQLITDSIVMVRDRANAKSVEIRLDIAPRLGTVEADHMKIRQIVVNLLANAVTYTPSGGVIEVRAFDRANRVHIEVDDTGPGVPAAYRERIFEEFGQAECADGGTGLGLALAKRFVELHGGSIWMQNRPTGGSSFRFWVPRATTGPVPGADRTSSDGDADYSAFTRPGSKSNRQLLGRMGPRMFMVSGAMWIVVAVLMSGSAVERLGIAAAGLLAAVGAAFAGPLFKSLSFRQIDSFGWFGAVSVSLLAYFGGPFADVLPFFFAWVTMITFALWPRRLVLIQFAGIAVMYAVVLAIKQPPAAVSQWLTVMLLLAFNAETVSWITRRLRGLVVAEQTAHRDARLLRAQLAAASTHKSSFIANMSHELRTPLNAVIGFAELLGTQLVGPLNETQREYIRDIDESARHLLAIINDVLDAAKLRAGQLSLQQDVVPVRALLERAVERGNQSGRAQLCDVHLDIEAGVEYVVADRQRLEQVLVQLISNAVKFSPSGGRVDVTARRAALDELHISVADSGIGILPSQYERIFDEFHQASLPVDQLPAGTGLGLSLARGLVEMHGGRIWVTSRPDGGSTFTVALPASATSVQALEQIVRAT